MTEERKHAILLATVILTARKLQPLLEEDDAAGKPNMAREFWAEIYVRNSMERAAHILDLIDKRWPALESSQPSLVQSTELNSR
ncbi:MAG: hypothetical protein ACYDCG_20670 [Candidatus Acidiferrales bacterium]